MKDDALLIRCSALGLIMTEPKSKSETLSVGAKTYLRELASEEIFGVSFEISDKKIEKGRIVEPDCIALVNRVHGLSCVKNTQRRNNKWLSGEPDVVNVDHGRDIKAAWSVATFPLSREDIAPAQRVLYDWQFRGYMMLWELPIWYGDYCLVNTPVELLGPFDPLPLHVVDRHVPEHIRVTTWQVERDAAIEEQIKEKVIAARAYYASVIAEFDRSHVFRGDLMGEKA